ncbi:MAG TPA: helix-turn-helix domain-containing protein [Candidatus Acidoferrum sp.]|nr:helix-turn-helix domain-containing protein [Candidatus Acidoferrum sp.]
MFDQDYYALRLVSLTGSEKWTPPDQGLCFVFNKRGTGQYSWGSLIRPLQPGDLLVLEGSREAKVGVAKGAEIIFWSFSMRLEHLIPLFGGNEISLLQSVADSFRNPKLYPTGSELALKCQRWIDEVPNHFDLEHRSHLLRIAGAVLNEEFHAVHHQRIGFGQVEGRVIEVFEQLTANQLLDLPVEQLAAKFGCSRRHLNRLFHQYFGLSVGALRMEMRLQKAVALLRDVEAKVINVAEQCGFNHLGLFNTCFKKRFGISPGRWRKQAEPPRTQSPLALPGSHLACPLQHKGLCPLLGNAFEASTPASAIEPTAKGSPEAKTAPGLTGPPPGIQPTAPLVYPKASHPQRPTL